MQYSEILKDLGPYQIQQYQQNRYPCFFVDFIEEVIPGKSAKGFKNFTYNEWFFSAHFADEPNVPGFVQIETLVQVFLMTFLTIPGNKGKKTAFVSSNAKFKKKLIPGHKLDITFPNGNIKVKVLNSTDYLIETHNGVYQKNVLPTN